MGAPGTCFLYRGWAAARDRGRGIKGYRLKGEVAGVIMVFLFGIFFRLSGWLLIRFLIQGPGFGGFRLFCDGGLTVCSGALGHMRGHHTHHVWTTISQLWPDGFNDRTRRAPPPDVSVAWKIAVGRGAGWGGGRLFAATVVRENKRQLVE